MLEAERSYLLRSWPNEANPGLLARFRKPGVLAQKSISGMNGLTTRLFGHRENLPGIQVALFGGRWPDPKSFIGPSNVSGMGIGVRIDRHRPDAQFVQIVNDPAGDLAAISYQNFSKHGATRWMLVPY